MAKALLKPVLLLGGSGSLGGRTAALLRRLHPNLPITIAGRDRAKAEGVARRLGRAEAAVIDLERADLGLETGIAYGAVVTALRDLSLNSLRFAERQGAAYVALSDAAFEIAPLVARHAHRPDAVAILMLGHSMGAVPMLAAAHLAASFARIDAIEIGLVFDPDDPLGPASAADMARITEAGPWPLILAEGRWRWTRPAEAGRRFEGIDGHAHTGEALGLLDVLSLGASSQAAAVRIDAAMAPTATSRRGLPPSHEVIIEITGARHGEAPRRQRHAIVDREGYAALSARGVALCVERLLGLTGEAPPAAGLYLPEVLVDPAWAMARLADMGTALVEI